MRLFYFLIASGLLMLTELSVEQPPPPVAHHPHVYVGRMQAVSGLSAHSYSTTIHSIYQTRDWTFSASPDIYDDLPGHLFLVDSKQEDIAAHQARSVKEDVRQDESKAFPSDTDTSPTPSTPTMVANGPMGTYGQPSALPITGYATYYNPNVMQQVVNNRLSMGQISSCNECVGTVALLRAGDINRRVWLQWANGAVEGPFLVVDAAASQHVSLLLARHWVVDVDNRTAVRHGMAGPVMVTVWDSPPEASQIATLPLLPLSYSTIPIADRKETQAQVPVGTPVPSATALPPSTSNSGNTASTTPGGFPTATTVPTITPLPAINNNPSPTPTLAQPTPTVSKPTSIPTSRSTPIPTATEVTATPVPTLMMVTVASGGFPIETEAPTITPLPAISHAPSPTPIVPQPTAEVSKPTSTPTMRNTPPATATLGPATTTLMPATAVPTLVMVTVAVGGFPTETEAPTITPLPPIIHTPTASATIDNSKIAPTSTATRLATAVPTSTNTPTSMSSPVVSATVLVHGGFPTETPVPTITPLPAISPLPSPIPTNIPK